MREGGFPAFPYTPYGIQTQLMQQLYETLQAGAVGLLESPTGTGKSLSVLCSALQWLRDHPTVPVTTPAAGTGDTGDPDWFAAAAVDQVQQRRDAERLELEQIVRRHRVRAEAPRDSKRPRSSAEKPDGVIDNDDDEALVLLDSDDVLERYRDIDGVDDDPAMRAGVAGGLLRQRTLDDDDGFDKIPHTRKVFITSRTHSQLDQFVDELRKLKAPLASPPIRVVRMASRQHACVNEHVRSLGSASRVNEACLDLRKSAGGVGCSYRSDVSKQRVLRDSLLTDIEDLDTVVRRGAVLRACPYYAARDAAPGAELVLLPYQSLFHAPTRESLGIELDGNVVIVDEAHNLIDTVNDMHSVCVGFDVIAQATEHLDAYFLHFQDRLAHRNVVQIKLLRRVLQQLADAQRLVPRSSDSSNGRSVARTIVSFLVDVQLATINLFGLLQWMNESKIAVKAATYADRCASTADARTGKGKRSASAPPLRAIASLLDCFCLDSREHEVGRVVLDATSVRYLVLDPSDKVMDVVQAAHAVVLVGGTMQPMDSLVAQVFPTVSDVHMFSCGHVVPGRQLLAMAVATGPSGRELSFTAEQRREAAMLEELRRCLVNVARIVRGGVVVFLPSYAYEDVVAQRLQSNAFPVPLIREPRGSAPLDAVLDAFRSAIEANGTAMLLSVVGGKLSEGINFADSLGRCVVLVGMPYPNRGSVELQERMRHANARAATTNFSGQQLYEALCMRAANQSIGRSIRHLRDYSSILLLDTRWTRPEKQLHLSGWIRDRLTPAPSWGTVHRHLARFFSSPPV